MTKPQGLLPLLALRNTVLFPGLTQVIKVGRDISVKALRAAEKNGNWIVALQQKNRTDNSLVDHDVEAGDLYPVGTLCRVESMKGSKEQGYQIVLRAIA